MGMLDQIEVLVFLEPPSDVREYETYTNLLITLSYGTIGTNIRSRENSIMSPKCPSPSPASRKYVFMASGILCMCPPVLFEKMYVLCETILGHTWKYRLFCET